MPAAFAMLLLALLAVSLAVGPPSSGPPSPEPSRHAVAVEAGVELAIVPAVVAVSARPWVDDRPLKARTSGLFAVLVLLIVGAPRPQYRGAALLAARTSLVHRRNAIFLRAPPAVSTRLAR